jgi:hypothetical protein
MARSSYLLLSVRQAQAGLLRLSGGQFRGFVRRFCRTLLQDTGREQLRELALSAHQLPPREFERRVLPLIFRFAEREYKVPTTPEALRRLDLTHSAGAGEAGTAVAADRPAAAAHLVPCGALTAPSHYRPRRPHQFWCPPANLAVFMECISLMRDLQARHTKRCKHSEKRSRVFIVVPYGNSFFPYYNTHSLSLSLSLSAS